MQQEIGRKQRLRTLRAAEPISTVLPPLPSVRLPGWPAARHLLFLTPTTELGASELRIRYTDRDDLLTQPALLALLAQAITVNPEDLESTTRQLRQVNPEREEVASLFAIWSSGRSASTLLNDHDVKVRGGSKGANKPDPTDLTIPNVLEIEESDLPSM